MREGRKEAAAGDGRGRGIRVPGLRRAREDAGYSVSDLEDASGVARSTISYLEDGVRGARGQTVRTLSRALGVPVSALTREPAERATVGGEGFPPDVVPSDAVGLAAREDFGDDPMDGGGYEAYEVLVALAPQRAAAEGISTEEALSRLVHEQVRLARAERRRKPRLRPLDDLPRVEGPNTAAAAVLADRG